MRPATAVILCLYCFSSTQAADPRWIRVQSANFEIYSTGGERATIDTVRQFEQVRGFFVQAMGHENDKPVPVRIIVFNSLKEYEPYRPNEVAIAYFHAGGEHDTIVMSHIGSETFPVAIHEYVHLVIEHFGIVVPPWLNEGLAEYYSTLQQRGNKVVIGDIIPGRLLALRQEKWAPLPVILTADANSPYYNEKNKAGSLYNEGWALTHMILLTREYRPKSQAFLDAIARGQDSITALTSIYGKPLAEIERDLQAYIRSDQFLAAIVPEKLEKQSATLTPEPVPAFDVRLVLAGLTNRPGKDAATRAQLQQLSAEQPNRAEPYAELGYFLWRHGDANAATEDFAKAFELGSRSPRLLWDYGRMAEQSDPSKSALALNELIKQQPARAEVRIELANAFLNANRANDALGVLKEIKTVTPKDAPRLFDVEARVQLTLGDRDNAKKSAEQFLKYAKTEDDRIRAQQLLDYAAGKGAPAATTTIATGEGAAPVLRRVPQQTTVTSVTTRRELPAVSGQFTQFVCGDPPRMVISTPSGNKTFVIRDPDKIVVSGRDGGKIDLTCGDQKPIKVRIEYSPAIEPGSDGTARAIEFEP
ncbi:MAG: hypothetical protein JO307_05280 [Bryobacterales bacterium]|nr:hypothetical protein [Bryobacterales bacterium]MBV9401036.1 hypothetical protein [Bryobacterales bacterium]